MDHMGAPFSRTEENKIAQRNFVVNPIHVLATLRIKLVTLFCTQLTNNA